MANRATLNASANDVGIAAPVTITAHGLAPNEHVALSSELTDEAGRVWRSDAIYASDAQGRFKTDKDAAGAGRYEGVDIGGPFWSPAPPGGRAAYLAQIFAGPPAPLAPEIDPLGATTWCIGAAQGGRTVAEISIVRRRLTGGVRHQVVRDGPLRGHYFEPEGAPPYPAVLVLGGSEGGVIPTRAAALAAEGMAALSLGYFDYEDRPRAAINLPIEYFVEGLRWLARRARGKVAIWGSSRGSEAAILTAAHAPDLVDAVIGWVPSHVVNTGFDMVGGVDFSLMRDAMWTIDGRPVAGAPDEAHTPDRLAARAEAFKSPPGYRFADEFMALWTRKGCEDAYALPAERIEAPILLVSGGDDAIWPSAYAADRLERRLKSLSFGFPVRHVCYPGVGHAIGVPNEPRPFSDIAHWCEGYSGVDNGFVAYGGTPAANAAAARAAWGEATSFLLGALS